MKLYRLTFVLFLMLLLNTKVNAVIPPTYYAIQSGDWNSPSTWSKAGCAGVPATSIPLSGSKVVICAGINVFVSGSAVTCAALEVKGTLDVRDSQFSVNGDVAVFGTGVLASSRSGSKLIFRGGVHVKPLGKLHFPLRSQFSFYGSVKNEGAFEVMNANQVYFKSNQTISGNRFITINATSARILANKTLKVSGGLSISNINGLDANSNLFLSANAQLEVKSELMSLGTLHATAPNSTVTYKGNATSRVIKPTNYFNLRIQAHRHLGDTTTVIGDLTIDNTGILDAKTESLKLLGGFVNKGTGVFNPDQSTVVLAGNNNSKIDINKPITFYKLLVAKFNRNLHVTSSDEIIVRQGLNLQQGCLVLQKELRYGGTATQLIHASGWIRTDYNSNSALIIASAGTNFSLPVGDMNKHTVEINNVANNASIRFTSAGADVPNGGLGTWVILNGNENPNITFNESNSANVVHGISKIIRKNTTLNIWDVRSTTYPSSNKYLTNYEFTAGIASKFGLYGTSNTFITVTNGNNAGVGSLRYAMSNIGNNGLITFTSSVTTVTLNSPIYHSSNHAITIDGKRSGQNKVFIKGRFSGSSLFDFSDVNITLKHLRLMKDGVGSTSVLTLRMSPTSRYKIDHCIIHNSKAGHVIAVQGNYTRNTIIKNTIFRNNETDDSCIKLDYGKVIFINCLLNKNKTNKLVEGTSISSSLVHMYNTTVADNEVNTAMFANDEVHVYNSIFWNNNNNTGTISSLVTGTMMTNFSNSLYPSSYNSSVTLPITTNIHQNPLFRNSSSGDYSVLTNSPAFNAGNNSFVTVVRDLAGNNRIANTTVDMGAYEVLVPQIKIFQNASFISSGQIHAFPSGNIGSEQIQEFEVRNMGQGDLIFISAPFITGSTDFRLVSSIPVGTVVPIHKSAKFKVAFTPDGNSDFHTASVFIRTNGFQSVYHVNLRGSIRFPGNAIKFTSSTSCTVAPFASVTPSLPYSVETWFKTQNSNQEIFLLSGGGDTEIFCQNNKIYYDDGALHEIANMQPGRWHHVALVNGYSSSTVYVNGVEKYAVSIPPLTGLTPTKLEIAHQLLSSMDLEIDEFRYWNKALTLSEIKSNMYKILPHSHPDMFAYYSFDRRIGITASAIHDKSGNGNHLTVCPSATQFIGHPEMRIQNASGSNLRHGGLVDLGTIYNGRSYDYQIKIKNLGNHKLIATPFVTIPSVFTTVNIQSSLIPKNRSKSLYLRFKAPAVPNQQFFATVKIHSSDIRVPLYFLTVTAKSGTSPEINVFTTSSKLNHQDKLQFNPTKIGLSKQKSLTVNNSGYDTLILGNGSAISALEIQGLHQRDFQIIKYPDLSIPSGRNSRFKIVFKPTEVGLRKARLRIYSNSRTNNPYTIFLRGQGVCTKVKNMKLVLPTQCHTSDGKIVLEMSHFIPNMRYNVDLNNNGIFESLGNVVSNDGILEIGNIAHKTKISSMRLVPIGFQACTLVKDSLNIFMTALGVPRSAVTLSTDITEISPNHPVTFTFNDAQSGVIYGLFDSNSDQQIGAFVSADPTGSATLKVSFLTADLSCYVIAKNPITGCETKINIAKNPIVQVFKYIKSDQLDILKMLYEQTGGGTTWDFEWDFSKKEIEGLKGVDIFAGNVIRINLPNMGMIDQIPHQVVTLPHLEYLNVSQNHLSFGSLENIIGKNIELVYDKQDSLGLRTNVKYIEDETLFLSVTTKGKYNTYQWYKNNELIQGANQATYFISAVQLSDVGVYYVEVANTQVDQEIMERHEITVTVLPKKSQVDIEPLKIFFRQLGGENWKNKWDFENISLYQQYGLEFIAEGNQVYVISMDLSDNNLVGKIPDNFNHKIFSRLKYINLSSNRIVGNIPKTITALSDLVFLDLSGNLYTGHVPRAIGNLEKLVSLSLSHNNFSYIPKGIFSNLKELQNLYLHNNRFKVLPSDIGDLENLENLNLSQNLLTDLPAEFQKLVHLRHLWLSDNQFTQLPNYITTFTDLQKLYLVNNFLTDLPVNLINLNLKYLAVFNNYLNHADLEPIVSHFANARTQSSPVLLYSPQARITDTKTYFMKQKSTLELSAPSFGKNNVYQWYKDGKPIPLPRSNKKVLRLSNISLSDAGVYHLEISNTINKDLILKSGNYVLSVGCGKNDQGVVLVDKNILLERCQGERFNILLRADKIDNHDIHWLRNGIKIVGATSRNWNTTLSGKYSFVLIDSSGCTSNSLNEITISEIKIPTDYSIQQKGDSLMVKPHENVVAYRWYLNGSPIENASNRAHLARTDGNYQVELISRTGCRGFSEPYRIRINAIENHLSPSENRLQVYPNPATNTLRVKIPAKYHYQSANIQIRDPHGKLISGKTQLLQPETQVNLSLLPRGYYILRIDAEEVILMEKFIVEK